MYYHQRPLKYVRFGRVGPPPVEVLEPGFAVAYRWLGRHCDFFPQVWLSRSRSGITGYRSASWSPESKTDLILFGFEGIQGFPVHYEVWCTVLSPLLSCADAAEGDAAIASTLDEMAQDPDWMSCEPDVGSNNPVAPLLEAWMASRDLPALLARFLFVKEDQVVVPALNLKAAKVVLCRNERQHAALRRMGFVKDRMRIRNTRPVS